MRRQTTGAPQLKWSACSWCPAKRSWHRSYQAVYQTGPWWAWNTAGSGRHSGTAPGEVCEIHWAVYASGWCDWPRHGIWISNVSWTSTAGIATRSWWYQLGLITERNGGHNCYSLSPFILVEYSQFFTCASKFNNFERVTQGENLLRFQSEHTVKLHYGVPFV